MEITPDIAKRGLAGVLLLQAGQYTMDVMSTLESSPWTGENVGADSEKVASMRRYMAHAVGVSTVYCAGAAWLAESWWPVIGSVVNNAYLIWIYNSAIKRAQIAASTGKVPDWGMDNARVNVDTVYGGSNAVQVYP